MLRNIIEQKIKNVDKEKDEKRGTPTANWLAGYADGLRFVLNRINVAEEVDHRELAAILAGLRCLQREMSFDEGDLEQFVDILTDNGELEPITENEIDSICEKINGAKILEVVDTKTLVYYTE